MVARRSTRTVMRLVAALAPAMLLAAVLAGCAPNEFPQSTFNPRSEFAGMIQSLNVQLIFWAVLIFLVVQTLLIIAIVRFRARPDSPEPKPVHGNTALEIAWTIAPAIILAFVAVPTVLTIFKTQAKPARTDLVVKVVGHQWWWEFQYPDLGIVTANEMHVPVGSTVAVDIATADVIHSFWFPAIGGKRDAIPGRPNRIWFTPDTVGVFPGQCAEFCGLSHANMRMKLMVDSPAAFAAWVELQKRPPAGGGAAPESTAAVGAAMAFAEAAPLPAGSPAARGKEIFSQSACIGCHTIRGFSAGVLGPDLTHFASRTTFAGSLFESTPDQVARWLTDPTGRKPGALMPNLGLTPEQVNALVAYLMSLE